MLYEFTSNSGERILRSYPAGKAPDIGRKIRLKGKSYTRVFSTNIVDATACDHDTYPKISKTLPQECEGADFVSTPGRDYGCPIIVSRRHQDELCRRHDFTREYHHSDVDHMPKDGVFGSMLSEDRTAAEMGLHAHTVEHPET